MRITANHISLSRILFLPLPCILIYGGTASQFAAAVLYALLGITDSLDGYVARRYGSTEFGKFLRENTGWEVSVPEYREEAILE